MALFVEFEEAGEDFVAEVVGPAITPGQFFFLDFFLVLRRQATKGRLVLLPLRSRAGTPQTALFAADSARSSQP